MTKAEHADAFQEVFDPNHQLESDWRSSTNVNYHYANSGKVTSYFGDHLYGNLYVQNDYDRSHYSEKFLLIAEDMTTTTLKVVCGPFTDDFESQSKILNRWAEQLKALSEKEE